MKTEPELPKILVVEENIQEQLTIKAALKQMEAVVYSANSGNEALVLVDENDFAVVLLDIQLSEMDGYETAELIRADEKLKHIPIIFITEVNKKDAHVFKGYESGAVDFIFKPINPFILMLKVKSFINLFNQNRGSSKLLLKELMSAKIKLEERNTQLEFLTKHDPLTSLPNRFAFEHELKRIIAGSTRYERKFALLFFDIDNFKWVNDIHGHDHGDIVLQQVGSILKTSVREEDFVARIGGDEFAGILTDINRYESAAIVADKIIKKLTAQHLQIYDKTLKITLSIGISCFPLCTGTAKKLMKQADIAMYRAKKLGRNNFCFYSDDINISFKSINTIREELQDAMQKRELFLNYQPIVNMNDKTIIGVEALLRWKNPKLGLIPPTEFISLAEENRIIHKIGLWVIEETCKLIKKCKTLKVKKIFFSVNLSPVQLERDTFTDELNRILKKYKTNPAQLDLELTETGISSFAASANKNYQIFLKQTHLRLSIDDFGTGFSSLDRLANLPINTLKIDGSFVTNIDKSEKANKIIRGIISLAKSLNMQTIAECVESKGQVDFLLKENCQLAQGFYFYKPMPAENLIGLLSIQK
jgi:diguanylate cyclase (GGDEF)-like protein